MPGPHNLDVGHNVDEGKTVFIRNLFHHSEEADLKSLMEELFGQVASTNLVMDKAIGRHRGTGFVKFRRRENALKAILEASPRGERGIFLDSRRLGVLMAQGREEFQQKMMMLEDESKAVRDTQEAQLKAARCEKAPDAGLLSYSLALNQGPGGATTPGLLAPAPRRPGPLTSPGCQPITPPPSLHHPNDHMGPVKSAAPVAREIINGCNCKVCCAFPLRTREGLPSEQDRPQVRLPVPAASCLRSRARACPPSDSKF